jgi:hypothetical protein
LGILIAIVVAIFLVGCGGSQPRSPHPPSQAQITALTGLKCGATMATACPVKVNRFASTYWYYCVLHTDLLYFAFSVFHPSGPLVNGYGSQSCAQNRRDVNQRVLQEGLFTELYMEWVNDHNNWHRMAFSHVKKQNGYQLIDAEADSNPCVSQPRWWHSYVRGWFLIFVDIPDSSVRVPAWFAGNWNSRPEKFNCNPSPRLTAG